ncbi:MAG: hypothetical protein FWB72_02790 [Firmicutes bacterium]|nr:hypothetical protein [Bacillota bacterium]
MIAKKAYNPINYKKVSREELYLYYERLKAALEKYKGNIKQCAGDAEVWECRQILLREKSGKVTMNSALKKGESYCRKSARPGDIEFYWKDNWAEAYLHLIIEIPTEGGPMRSRQFVYLGAFTAYSFRTKVRGLDAFPSEQAVNRRTRPTRNIMWGFIHPVDEEGCTVCGTPVCEDEQSNREAEYAKEYIQMLLDSGKTERARITQRQLNKLIVAVPENERHMPRELRLDTRIPLESRLFYLEFITLRDESDRIVLKNREVAEYYGVKKRLVDKYISLYREVGYIVSNNCTRHRVLTVVKTFV